MKGIQDILEEVKDEATFLTFVRTLIADRAQHEAKPADKTGRTEDWANNTITGFLESAVAWAEDSNFGAKQSKELSQNKWKQFAVFLYCGKVYE